MSDSPPSREPQPAGAAPADGTFAIVASRYNERYVDAMLDAARQEIAASAPGASVSVHRVPGAFEIPTCIEAVVRRDRPDAVIALGVVIAGETAHADIVARSVATALIDISREHLVPVINEVLLLDNEDQAAERCLGARINRGTEAGQSALEMARLFRGQFEPKSKSKPEA